jgi:hypothetical protein
MKEKGIVWLDDYEGRENSEKVIKNAINNFRNITQKLNNWERISNHF